MCIRMMRNTIIHGTTSSIGLFVIIMAISHFRERSTELLHTFCYKSCIPFSNRTKMSYFSLWIHGRISTCFQVRQFFACRSYGERFISNFHSMLKMTGIAKTERIKVTKTPIVASVFQFERCILDFLIFVTQDNNKSYTICQIFHGSLSN